MNFTVDSSSQTVQILSVQSRNPEYATNANHISPFKGSVRKTLPTGQGLGARQVLDLTDPGFFRSPEPSLLLRVCPLELGGNTRAGEITKPTALKMSPRLSLHRWGLAVSVGAIKPCGFRREEVCQRLSKNYTLAPHRRSGLTSILSRMLACPSTPHRSGLKVPAVNPIRQRTHSTGISPHDGFSKCPCCGYYAFNGRECFDCGYRVKRDDEDFGRLAAGGSLGKPLDGAEERNPSPGAGSQPRNTGSGFKPRNVHSLCPSDGSYGMTSRALSGRSSEGL